MGCKLWSFLLSVLAFSVVNCGILYSSLGGDPLQLCTNVPILLSYTAPDGTVQSSSTGFKWAVSPSDSCSCNGTKLCPPDVLSVTLVCSRPQLVNITVQAPSGPPGSSDLLRLDIGNCQDMYGWYAVPVAVPFQSGDMASVVKDAKWDHENLTIRAWIISRAMATPEELAGAALLPSAKSANITKIFHDMGLTPYLKTDFSDQHDIFFYCGNQTRLNFDPRRSFWIFSCCRINNDRYGIYQKTEPSSPCTADGPVSQVCGFDATTYDSTTAARCAGTDVAVASACTGKEVPIYRISAPVIPTVDLTYQMKTVVQVLGRYNYLGYGISDTELTFSRPKFSFPPATSVVLSHSFSTPVVRFEPCGTNTAVVFLPGVPVQLTSDEFVTIQLLHVQTGGSTAVADIVLTQTYMIILTALGDLYQLNRNDTSGVAKQIPNVSGLKGVRGIDWCVYGSHDDSRDQLIVWNETTILVGTPSSFRTVSTPGYLNLNPAGNQIVDAVFDSVPGKNAVVVLVKFAASYFLYNVPNAKSSLSPAWMQIGTPIANSTGAPRLYTLLGGNLAVIVTFKEAIYQVVAESGYPVKFALLGAISATEEIRMGRLTEAGDLYFVTTTNKLYYGTASVVNLIPLKTPVSPNTVVWVDRFNRLSVMVFDGNSTVTVTRRPFDLDTELLNANYTEPCPFTIFSVHGWEPWYQLDSLDQYTMVGQLWFNKNSSTAAAQNLDVIVRDGSFSGYGPVSNITTRQESYGDLVKITRVVTIINGSFFSSWIRNSVKGYVNKDATSVTFRPRVLAPSCTQRTQVVSFVQTACPTGLSIRLIPQFPCSNYTSSFTILKKYLWNSGSGDVIGLAEPGLPCESPYYGDGYRPRLALYYFDTFVENVTVDFYVFDANGRKDYVYSMTEADAGCRRSAQTATSWNSSVVGSPDSVRAWNAKTYKDCYSSDSPGFVASSTKSYEIFNASGGNSMVFQSDHSAVYIMVAQVLANNYSFCDLQVKFVLAPYGYGDIPDPLILIYMFLASIFACLLFFAVVYAIYALSWNENRVGFDMLGKQKHPQAWHLLNDGEHKLLYDGQDESQPKRLFVPPEVLDQPKISD